MIYRLTPFDPPPLRPNWKSSFGFQFTQSWIWTHVAFIPRLIISFHHLLLWRHSSLTQVFLLYCLWLSLFSFLSPLFLFLPCPSVIFSTCHFLSLFLFSYPQSILFTISLHFTFISPSRSINSLLPCLYPFSLLHLLFFFFWHPSSSFFPPPSSSLPPPLSPP